MEESFMEESEKAKVESPPKKPSARKKVLLFFLGIIAVGLIAVFSIYSYLYAKGEENLKAPEDSSASGKSSAILYNGREYTYKKDIINILCMGIDKDIPMEQKGETGSLGLNDANFIVSIDTKEETVKVIAIPRDSMVEIKVLDAAGNVTAIEKKQLCYQYAYGRTSEQSGELSAEAVSKLLHLVPVQRYCAINFEALPVINDAVGGVDVTVLEDMPWSEYDGFTKGRELHLEGHVAIEYVRRRDVFKSSSNLNRMERQKQYAINFFKQAKQAVKKDPSIPLKVFDEITENMNTTLTAEDITYLVPKLLKASLDEEQIVTVPGEQRKGEQYEEYHVDDEALKEMIIDIFYEEVN